MPSQPLPVCFNHSVHIREIACQTCHGSASESVSALLRNEVGLRFTPIYGEDGGDSVPLALRSPMQKSLPPRWWSDLLSFIQPLVSADWGTVRRPVFLTSSNFGIDALYGVSSERDVSYAPWATPHGCLAFLKKELGWGDNVTILSHACVSAQLGLYQAAQSIHQDFADEALVLSFDYVGPFVAAGFHSLKILNGQMPAPYQAQEFGSIGIGDGMAYAILDKQDKAPRITAQALYNEMYHFTSNAPDASGFTKTILSIQQALESDNYWIKGHGTGTLEAGRFEAETTNKLLPGHPLVSWKGSIGHTLGSCALVELALALAAHEQGEIPGTVATTGECLAPNVQKDSFAAKDFDSTLFLSNAFGGAHGAMVVSYV
ncbi:MULTISPECIES: hypothetical protein [unclassified Lentimonas]|uniref:hypothetical protein n=1 Tax=unclassified Lentimonas TaxID=2630993 RepID=UPI0013208BFA|nr:MULTISPECIES: hypothetical protein [unclassified Lentimonas]CAA6679612.1 Unannotated [Lentimonas sp. CC4]CAA6687330.1 Unannotated [Lentimonas sp. CC6]CAA7077225.1 Unannotated [Lentimonas sp. CC4]CAA7171756.1 Unannotated [Lentimonas sp. CC21]CAA7183559.1 Unannotated [Lentimonas sp. CC8]